jgi:adenylate cyclase
LVKDLTEMTALLSTATKAPSNAATSNRSTETFEDCTILIVDDMPENLDLMSRLLRKMDCTIVTANSGDAALATLATTRVDLVLLDLVMPGTDGREVLARIKSDEDLRAIPVIMISGRQDMDQIIDCIQVGADDYLLKPVNAVLLTARIKSGIERKRWHDKEASYREQLEKREQFIRQTFGRYISDAIVEEILEKPEGLKLGGDLRHVTLMMSDIRSFTTLVEHLPPEQVMALLNRYLGKMTDIILHHGGTIDEFLGDAVLAAFGAPSVSADHATKAVNCAIQMQEAMAEINAENIADGLPIIEMAIALNTGEVVAGNIGSERRSKYGFVGHQVNLTSRIEDDARPHEILISEQTYRALNGDHFVAGESRTIKAKGIEELLTVYPIVGSSSNA